MLFTTLTLIIERKQIMSKFGCMLNLPFLLILLTSTHFNYTSFILFIFNMFCTIVCTHLFQGMILTYLVILYRNWLSLLTFVNTTVYEDSMMVKPFFTTNFKNTKLAKHEDFIELIDMSWYVFYA